MTGFAIRKHSDEDEKSQRADELKQNEETN